MSRLDQKRDDPEREIVLGTKNRNKLRELRMLLEGSGIRVLSLDNFSGCPAVIENGRTFRENAEKKARGYSWHTGGIVVADDSGLVVSALGGKPGVYSARFAGRGCSYSDNNRKLLRLMAGMTGSKRKARFVCVAAIAEKGRNLKSVRGECAGRITLVPRGRHGFGYDPVFIPSGLRRTFAELDPRDKNRISHRARALRKAKQAIMSYLKSQVHTVTPRRR